MLNISVLYVKKSSLSTKTLIFSFFFTTDTLV